MTNELISINDYKEILEIIYEHHYEYCTDWINGFNSNQRIHLRKKYVSDFFDANNGLDNRFKDYMYSFTSKLLLLQLEVSDIINQDLNIDIRARIKSPDSIIDKMYWKCKDQEGKFAVNKVLNDLLGFRIIDSNYGQNIEDIINHIEFLESKKVRIKGVFRKKENYTGYHIYFMGPSNHVFPTELQIWDSNNEKENILSHKKYKQGYILDMNKHNVFRKR